MRRKLLLLERHRLITEMVERNQQVTVTELADKFAKSSEPMAKRHCKTLKLKNFCTSAYVTGEVNTVEESE